MRQLRRRRDAGDSTSDVDDLHHTRAPPRNAPQQFRCRWLWQLVTRDGPNEFRCSYTAMNGSLGASARGRLLCSCFRFQRQSPCTPARLERDVASARSCRGRPSRRWFANPLFARLASRSSVRAEEVGCHAAQQIAARSGRVFLNSLHTRCTMITLSLGPFRRRCESFHRTSPANVRSILKDGFRDCKARS